jgi:hypothetical protein
VDFTEGLEIERVVDAFERSARNGAWVRPDAP